MCYFLRDDREEKVGQIAHINGDRSDSRPANLVWLCFDHHDRYDSKTSQSKNLTPGEVRIYRDRLVKELQVTATDDHVTPKEALDVYTVRFEQAYSHKIQKLIDFECFNDGRSYQATAIGKLIADGSNAQLVGPSGCGKTLVSLFAGLASIELGCIPIILRGKDYFGDLRKALDLEVRSLVAYDLSTLLTACKRTESRPLIVLDGFNECSNDHQDRLLNSLIAESTAANAVVLVSSQVPLNNADSLSFQTFEFTPPSSELKTSLVKQGLGDSIMTPNVAALLDVVQTSVEAVLLGQLGKDLPESASRFHAFYQFARTRLAPLESEGVSVLSVIAGYLNESLSFSLSVPEAERLLQEFEPSGKGLSAALDGGLLVQRGGRISFGHELFLEAFGAEAIVRSSGADSSRIVATLKSPRQRSKRSLIVGAIDSDEILLEILNKIDSVSLLVDCLSGVCGKFAKLWAERRATDLLARAASEVESIELAVNSEGRLSLSPSLVYEWTTQDFCMLEAIADRLLVGELVEELLKIVSLLDRKLELEQLRLGASGKDSDHLFQEIYVLWNRLGVAAIIRSLKPSVPARCLSQKEFIEMRLLQDELSVGQLYALVMLCRSSRQDSDWFVRMMPRLFDQYWSRAPYHLRLELLEAAMYCHSEDDELRAKIVCSLEAIPNPTNPFIATAWVEALSALGALEEDETAHLEVARNELKACLENSNSPARQTDSFNIWISQIDHPYGMAYTEAIGELSPDERHIFLSMAAMNADDRPFVGTLLDEICSTGDPSFEPVLRRWIRLPKRDALMHQDVLQAFVLAHATLGWLACDPPHVIPEGDLETAKALIACGELLYWANRRDLSKVEKNKACSAPLAHLRSGAHGVSPDAMWLIHNAILNRKTAETDKCPVTCVVEAFPNEALAIFRACLEHQDIQQNYFPGHGVWQTNRIMQFGMQVISEYGDVNDLSLLMRYEEHPDLGHSAIAALQKIKRRMHDDSN